MDIPTSTDIRTARKANGLSQSTVAEKADVSQPLISRIEGDDVDPRLSTLHAISLAINGSEPGFDKEHLEVIVPEAIRNRREAAGLTQQELADEAGVSQPLISRIEGESIDPRASTLRAVLDILSDDSTGETTDCMESPHAETESAATTPESSEVGGQANSDVLSEIESEFEQLQRSSTN